MAREDDDILSVENQCILLNFSKITGRLYFILNKEKNIPISLNQSLLWYNASNRVVWDDWVEDQVSGAYIFRPNRSEPFTFDEFNENSSLVMPYGVANLTLLTEGDGVVHEVLQVFGKYAYQIVRLYSNTCHVEIEYTIGPIDVSDNQGKEIITRFYSDIDNNQQFMTDANGRQWNQRYTINNSDEFAASNYYPVNVGIFLQENTSKSADGRVLSILTDRAVGASSLGDGQLEIMLHRRLLEDDRRGMAEPLNETVNNGSGLVVRSKHFIVVDSHDNAAVSRHRLIEELSHPIQPFFLPIIKNPRKIEFVTNQTKEIKTHTLQTAVSINSDNFCDVYQCNFSTGISLPHNLRIEHFHIQFPIPKDSSIRPNVVLRLSHIYEYGETEGSESKDVTTIPLSPFINLVQNGRKVDVIEYTLSANIPISQLTRKKWLVTPVLNTNDVIKQSNKTAVSSSCIVNDETISLVPLQICTFIISELVSPPDTSSGISTATALAIAIPLSVVFILVVVFYLRSKKTKYAYDNIPLATD